MIEKIGIQNFRSLKNLKFDLRPLNVLIGPNNAGKSNFIDFFRLLFEASYGLFSNGIAARGGLDGLKFRSNMYDKTVLYSVFNNNDSPWSSIAPAPFSAFQVPESQGPIGYGVQLSSIGTYWHIIKEDLLGGNKQSFMTRDQASCIFYNNQGKPDMKQVESIAELAISQIKDPFFYPVAYEVLSQFQNWAIFDFNDIEIKRQLRMPQVVRSGARLFPSGENLFSVLSNIQNKSPNIWDEIIEIIKIAYPDLIRVTLPPEGGDGKILLRWWEEPFRDFGFSANLISDGTLRFLYLVTLLKSPEPPSLVCIDEPEIGLHPDLIGIVAELLQDAATRTQLIVSTHSPDLVSKLKPSEIVVVEKEEGATVMSRLDDDELKDWRDKFQLGDLWRAGHFGGRP